MLRSLYLFRVCLSFVEHGLYCSTTADKLSISSDFSSYYLSILLVAKESPARYHIKELYSGGDTKKAEKIRVS